MTISISSAALTDDGIVLTLSDGKTLKVNPVTAISLSGTDISGGAGETNYALETGGNLATVATAQGAGGTGISEPAGGSGLLGWLSGIYKVLLAALPTARGSATMVNSLPVVVASDQVLSVNLLDVDGAGVVLGQTTKSASIPVVLPSDQLPLSVNLLDIGGTAVLPGSQTMAHSLSIAVASDQTPVPVSVASGQIASGAVASGAFASGALASGSVSSGAYASGSIADGAMVTTGTKADAAASGTQNTGSGTVIGLLKGIMNALLSQLAFGYQASSSSIPVVNAAPTNSTDSQVSVLVTSTTLLASRATRIRAIFKNIDTTNPVYINFANGSATTGNFPLKAGESVEMKGTGATKAIATGGTVVVAVIEEYY